MEKSETRETPICRKRPLRSRTVDTLLRILSLCSDPLIQNSYSDKSIRTDDCTGSIPNESLFQEQTSMDETQVVMDTQKDGSYNKHVESPKHDPNISGEKKDLSQKVNTNPSVNVDIKSHDNYDMICSSPHLPTNEDAEEGEIARDFMDVMPEIDTKSVGETGTNPEPRDSICTKTGLKDDSNITPLFTEAVKDGGIDAAGVVNKTTRNLVDYSEIAVHAKSHESVKQATLKVNATKNQDQVHLVKDSGAQNNKKRQGLCMQEERRNKKSKKSVDPTICPENITLFGEHLQNASQEVVASVNKDACNEKKKKRVVTKERKAKKKIKDRIKRAEKRLKLGVKRLKLQPVVKEKKITYCRHYMNGRCHEGEKCKFSHDTTPLTKSKPCCHFARHACMKGDDCPFDHELSKYPCNNYQTTGSCNRGSDCMFSHEIQPSEDSLNESKPEQKPPSNSGSKKVETKSCSVPKFVDITPKSTHPPKGINFLSQEKLPLVSRPPKGISFLSQEKLTPESRLAPKVDSEVKEITKTPPLLQDSEEKTKVPPVVLLHDSEEITKTPTVVPRGINFLSFGKKPGLDYSNGGYSLRISNRVEKSRLSNVAGEGLTPGSTTNVVNEVKVDRSTDGPSSSKKPMPMISFMSSTSQKALRSTLAFACELDSGVKSKV
ncbi:putative transcription factor C3H family [Helianthus annuus]|uniref:Putative zinc finger, CCCH-type n=1 Tax=Helianthus annuus TaxID=4232 RepID=A0A251V3V4_HELAN|nr:zinc finger CCCH domain-containing protein 65 [Helianthus annuus]KAF5812493.1 putative transcription factor C3H family [Helianthus annuus]KAJ0495640.1 putative transcription factor C3H family [Helianthus annuus]KAJ0591444.1 putative transcription factor C3H family [Helianthus annuus]KAJ0606331.1 putative transcription factor C3H family [Helianthus annuus]KAJ0766423.1 putative transcription factor C3H family [Helianthus annuus]